MKRIVLGVAVVLGVMLGGVAAAQDAGGEKVLLGPLSVEQLIDLPDWFGRDFTGYTPAQVFLADMPDAMRDVEILCVLGTWCSDSRREVPRLIRIMQITGLDPAKLKMVGADRNKMSPAGESAVYQIEKVPTFVFLRNGAEIGRIVETPRHSIERDMLAIIRPDAQVLQALTQPVPADQPPPPHDPPAPPVPSDAASPDGVVK
jgi:thiol-disulfide isomerase/thioredoxin